MSYTRSKKSKKKHEKTRKIILFFLFLLTITFATFFFVMRSGYVQVTEVVISGNNFVSEQAINSVVEKHLVGNKLLFVPKRNIFLFDTKGIKKVLKNTFRELEIVTIERIGLTRVSVTVTERLDQYLYCDSESCLSFDDTGFIFMNSLKTKEDTDYYFSSTDEYTLGDTFIGQKRIRALTVLVNSLQKKGLEIKHVEEYTDFTFVLETSSGTRILVPAQDSYDDIYSVFVKLLATEDFLLDKERSDFRQEFAYINIQFGKKIFSCLVGEECENNYR